MFKTTYKDNASVVDGKLILSFPNATKPIVWQMDLQNIKESALELNDNKEGFELAFKTPKGETKTIAPFPNRDQALNGLMVASKALEKAHGHIHQKQSQMQPLQTQPHTHKKGLGKTLLIILAGLGLIALLMTLLSAMQAKTITTQRPSAATGQSAEAPTGVPLSADDFLNR